MLLMNMWVVWFLLVSYERVLVLIRRSDNPPAPDRSLPITSHPDCKLKYSNEANLPTTSGVVLSLSLSKSDPLCLHSHHHLPQRGLDDVAQDCPLCGVSVSLASPQVKLQFQNTQLSSQWHFSEVILVNDGSTFEHLGEKLEKYFEYWPRVKIINSVQRVGLIRLIFIIIHREAAGSEMSVNHDNWLKPKSVLSTGVACWEQRRPQEKFSPSWTPTARWLRAGSCRSSTG